MPALLPRQLHVRGQAAEAPERCGRGSTAALDGAAPAARLPREHHDRFGKHRPPAALVVRRADGGHELPDAGRRAPAERGALQELQRRLRLRPQGTAHQPALRLPPQAPDLLRPPPAAAGGPAVVLRRGAGRGRRGARRGREQPAGRRGPGAGRADLPHARGGLRRLPPGLRPRGPLRRAGRPAAHPDFRGPRLADVPDHGAVRGLPGHRARGLPVARAAHDAGEHDPARRAPGLRRVRASLSAPRAAVGRHQARCTG
mmetsp:Transcript_3193/g.10029  ORF Transcript_3193/g.10029 Transcript_3193/m.10029 type:complete len:258 (-) Transcript_3193:54-827(-)